MTLPSDDRLSSPAPANGLELPLVRIEAQLAALSAALRRGDNAEIERHAGGLHRALADAVDRFTSAARQGQVPPELRRRLVNAGGQVAAQRESLARATAALDRAIDALLPREAPAGVYAHPGTTERPRLGGSLQA